MTKLFVGSLPYSTTSQDLNDLFAQFGTVTSATVINDKFTGKSKGFGFVEMDDDNAAQTAIAQLNDKPLPNSDNPRNIFVSVARPREEGSGGGGRPQGGGRDFNRGGGGGYNRGGGGGSRGGGGYNRGGDRGGYQGDR